MFSKISAAWNMETTGSKSLRPLFAWSRHLDTNWEISFTSLLYSNALEEGNIALFYKYQKMHSAKKVRTNSTKRFCWISPIWLSNTPLRINIGIIIGNDYGDENTRRRRNVLLKVTVLSCHVKLKSKTALWNKCRRVAKTVFTKAPLSLTSAQGHLFCCKTKTTKYALLKYK